MDLAGLVSVVVELSLRARPCVLVAPPPPAPDLLRFWMFRRAWPWARCVVVRFEEVTTWN
ncbi:MAG: hypothetical protein WKG00_14930 [Polyangiaceae bacterium]